MTAKKNPEVIARTGVGHSCSQLGLVKHSSHDNPQETLKRVGLAVSYDNPQEILKRVGLAGRGGTRL